MGRAERELPEEPEDLGQVDLGVDELVEVYGLSEGSAEILDDGESGWRRAFAQDTGVLEQVLGDMIRLHAAVPGKVGARPMPLEEDVDVAFLFWGDEG